MARAVAKQGFTMIPDAIAHRTDLSPLAKSIYGFMVRRARNGHLSLGARFLAEFWGSSKSRVAYALTRLEEVGLIAVERAGVGKRYTYKVLQYHNKASNGGTLSGEETGHWRDTPATGGTEVATGGTRKREETSESNKNPPTPQGGRESSLSPDGIRKESAAKSDGASEGCTAALALFYPSGPPATGRRGINTALADLDRFSATSDDVVGRHRRWPEKFPNATCTLKGLVKHWGVLAPPKPNPYDPYAGKPPSVPPRD